MLHTREEEMLAPTVRAFMKTEAFRDCILDGEVGIVRFTNYIFNPRCLGGALFMFGWCSANLGD